MMIFFLGYISGFILSFMGTIIIVKSGKQFWIWDIEDSTDIFVLSMGSWASVALLLMQLFYIVVLDSKLSKNIYKGYSDLVSVLTKGKI